MPVVALNHSSRVTMVWRTPDLIDVTTTRMLSVTVSI